MAGSMAGFSVTQACLTEQEWEAQAAQMGMGPAEREGLQCLMRELGGPGAMAAAMIAAGQGDISTLSAAAMACGLDMGSGRRPGPHVQPAATSGADQSGVYAAAGAHSDRSHSNGGTGTDQSDGVGDHPGDQSRGDTAGHPDLQQVRVEALAGPRRRLAQGRPAAGDRTRTPGQ